MEYNVDKWDKLLVWIFGALLVEGSLLLSCGSITVVSEAVTMRFDIGYIGLGLLGGISGFFILITMLPIFLKEVHRVYRNKSYMGKQT